MTNETRFTNWGVYEIDIIYNNDIEPPIVMLRWLEEEVQYDAFNEKNESCEKISTKKLFTYHFAKNTTNIARRSPS